MNYKVLIILIFILFPAKKLEAQDKSEIRTYSRTFPAARDLAVEIINKYGSVHFTNWEKDSVEIRAEVKANGDDQSKLSKMFDGLNIEITGNEFVVRGTTEFSQNFNMLIESFKGMTSKIIPYDSKLEIDYYVNVPDYTDIKIDNKYGDVFMEDCKGRSDISVSNGSLKAGSLTGSSTLNLTFCDASIHSLASGRIESSLSETKIGETSSLNIKSIGSKYDIRKAGTVRIDSRRDKIFLGNTGSLTGTSYFTDFRIDNLIQDLNLDTKYGEVSAENIDQGFNSVNIISSYSDISLDFDENCSYKIDIRHTNSFLVLPESNTEKKVLNNEKKEYLVTGTVGKNPGKSEVRIEATRGNIYLE